MIAAWTSDWAKARGLAVTFTDTTASTNDDAKRAGASAPDRLHVTARQTAGRGRGTNRWLDPGSALLSTWARRLPGPAGAITGPRVGLALFAAARATWPDLAWALKAPNDLWLDGAKVAGLLIETISSGPEHRLLVGLGFNVGAGPRVDGREVTHLAAALDRSPARADWERFLDAWLTELLASVDAITRPELSDADRARLKHALNARGERQILEVTAAGDLVYADGGVTRWTEL